MSCGHASRLVASLFVGLVVVLVATVVVILVVVVGVGGEDQQRHQMLRRQTEVLVAWRARLGSIVASWGLIFALLTGTGIAVAWRSREVALRTQGVLDQILENQAQLQAAKAKAQAGKAGRRP